MMKCKIVHNEGKIWILLFIFIITTSNCAFVPERSQTIQELCTNNKFIYSVTLDESQLLKLTASNPSGIVNKWYQKSKKKCRKEFTTNNGDSHLFIVISNMTIPSCSAKCHCNYFEIGEPYEGGETSEKFCGSSKEEIYFESKSHFVYIDFHHGSTMLFDVTITLSVRRNTYILEGAPGKDHHSGQFIETPYYPNPYETDYTSEYILQSNDLSAHVMLMFLDFKIAVKSFIEVFGHNGTHPGIFYGNIFRPPVFVSQKHQLNLKFDAKRQHGSGFRAVCFFLKDTDLKLEVPYTNCGGAKDDSGGVIEIAQTDQHMYYDCIWHLSPPGLFGTAYYLSVSNINIENIGPNAVVEFREGLSSKSRLVESLTCEDSECSGLPQEIAVPALSGLYIRFNGLLHPHSVLNMTYTVYRNGNCSDREMECNERCLPASLHCDGVIHCPDGSDEDSCFTPTVDSTTTLQPTVVSRMQSTNTVAVFLVVLSFGIFGLIIIVAILIMVFYRHYKKNRDPLAMAENPQAVNELLEPMPYHPHDPPPSYDDFLRSSHFYPPLLFTRASKRNSEPFHQHTTSFSHPPRRVAHSFDLHSLSSTSSDSVVEWCLKPFLQRSNSLDSRCHLHLSITHSVANCCTGGECPQTGGDCPQTGGDCLQTGGDCLQTGGDCHQIGLSCQKGGACRQTDGAKYHSLPTRLKVDELRPDVVYQSSCKFCLSRVRTTVKARCFSDPCHSVGFRCSLRNSIK